MLRTSFLLLFFLKWHSTPRSKPPGKVTLSNIFVPQLVRGRFPTSKIAILTLHPFHFQTSMKASILPVSAATSFLYSLATNRTKSAFLPTLNFINNVLGSYVSFPNSQSGLSAYHLPFPRNASPAHRFGALNMTAALGPWMLAHPDVKNKMEPFVMQFVVPEYTSSEPYLRAVVRAHSG